jgi:uncharacterized protein involved in exopolysaccharide biosynthesis
VSRIRLSGLEHEREYWAADTTRGRHGTSGSLPEFPQLDTTVERLELERELAARAYADLFTRHEQARIKSARAEAAVQVVIPASPPSASSRVSVATGSVAGAIAGLLLSLVLAAGRDYLTRARPPQAVP